MRARVYIYLSKYVLKYNVILELCNNNGNYILFFVE